MRLDLFLKASRLVPRRSLAQEFCDKNMIRVNDMVAKSSKTVSVGDRIEIRRRDKITVVKIDAVPATKQMSKESAAKLYSVLSETSQSEENL